MIHSPRSYTQPARANDIFEYPRHGIGIMSRGDKIQIVCTLFNEPVKGSHDLVVGHRNPRFSAAYLAVLAIHAPEVTAAEEHGARAVCAADTRLLPKCSAARASLTVLGLRQYPCLTSRSTPQCLGHSVHSITVLIPFFE